MQNRREKEVIFLNVVSVLVVGGGMWRDTEIFLFGRKEGMGFW